MKPTKKDSLVAGLEVECEFRTLFGERILAKDYLRMCPRFERMHHLGGSAHFDRDDYEISTFPILYSLRDLPTAKLSLTLNRLLATIESDFYKASEMLSMATGKEVFAVPNNIHISKSSASHDPNRNYQPIGVIERGFVSNASPMIKSPSPASQRPHDRTKFRKEILTVYRLDFEVEVGRSPLRRRGDLLDLSEVFGDDQVVEQAWRVSGVTQAQVVAELSAGLAEPGPVRAGVCRTWNWALEWNTVVALRKINKITVGGWDVPIHGEKSYGDLRWLLASTNFGASPQEWST
jgi:hypothetical protein